jgi:hypothetical protein
MAEITEEKNAMMAPITEIAPPSPWPSPSRGEGQKEANPIH